MQHSRQTKKMKTYIQEAKQVTSDDELLHDDVRKRGRTIQKSNVLFDYHALVLSIINPVTEEILSECGWAESTYYRKRKPSEDTISNAEREKIIEILTKRKKEFDKDFALFIENAKGGSLLRKRRF